MKTSIKSAAIDAFFFMYSVVLFTVVLIKRFPLTTLFIASAVFSYFFPLLAIMIVPGVVAGVLFHKFSN